MQRHIDLHKVHSHLICGLCKGYLIGATTSVECLHSFCKSCIVQYLESSFNCPVCKMEIHKTKPLDNLRSDPTLQEIVYKMIPELYFKEQSLERSFKEIHSEEKESVPSGQLEEDDSRILVTLKYFRGTSRLERIRTEKVLQIFPTRYLCCPSEMPVGVLKKLVLHKFDLSADMWTLDIWRGDETLLDELPLRQLVQIYGCYRERKPLELHFSLLPKFPTSSKPTKKEIPLYKRAIPPMPKEDTTEEPEPRKEVNTSTEIQPGLSNSELPSSSSASMLTDDVHMEEASETKIELNHANDGNSNVCSVTQTSSLTMEDNKTTTSPSEKIGASNNSDMSQITMKSILDDISKQEMSTSKTMKSILDDIIKEETSTSENNGGEVQMAEEAPDQANEAYSACIPNDEAPPEDKL